MAAIIGEKWLSRIRELWRWYKSQRGNSVTASPLPQRQIVIGNEIVLAVVDETPTNNTVSVKFVGEDRETPWGDAFDVKTFLPGGTAPDVEDGDIIPIANIQQQWYYLAQSGGGDNNATHTFIVKVTKDGGSSGSFSSTCSYTYTCKTLSGDSLGTGISPETHRITNVAYTAPGDNSYGIGFYDGETFKLYSAAEEVVASENRTMTESYHVDGHEFKQVTRQLRVLESDDSTSETTVFTAPSATVQESYRISGNVFKMTQKTIYVIEDGTDTETDVHTGTNCGEE